MGRLKSEQFDGGFKTFRPRPKHMTNRFVIKSMVFAQRTFVRSESCDPNKSRRTHDACQHRMRPRGPRTLVNSRTPTPLINRPAVRFLAAVRRIWEEEAQQDGPDSIPCACPAAPEVCWQCLVSSRHQMARHVQGRDVDSWYQAWGCGRQG